MNSTDRFEFGLIREDQTRIQRMVRELDARIDVLGRSLEASSNVPPEPRPAPPPPPLPAVPERRMPSWNEEPAPEPATSVPEPDPTPEPAPSTPAEPFELRVGTYWMARIGIVILLTGLVFLGNYAYHRIVPMLGAWGKLSLLALSGVALGGLGAWLERSRESMRNYARVLLAGGAATIYYTAYAAHFVDALRVIESPVLGGALLLALAGGFMAWADRKRSEALAVPAVLLAYYTSAINSIGGFTLFSNLLLTAAEDYFLVLQLWTRLTYVSLAATYGSYAFWRFNRSCRSAARAANSAWASRSSRDTGFFSRPRFSSLRRRLCAAPSGSHFSRRTTVHSSPSRRSISPRIGRTFFGCSRSATVPSCSCSRQSRRGCDRRSVPSTARISRKGSRSSRSAWRQSSPARSSRSCSRWKV